MLPSSAYTADPHAQAGVAKTPSTGTQAAMTKAAAAEAAAKACMAKAPATEGHSTAAAIPPPPAASAGAEIASARASPATAGKNNLCIIAVLRAFRAPVSPSNAASFGEFELGSESWPRAFCRGFGQDEQKAGTGDGSSFLLTLCPRRALWLSGGGLRAFSRINSGNSELYRRRRKNVAVARWID